MDPPQKNCSNDFNRAESLEKNGVLNQTKVRPDKPTCLWKFCWTAIFAAVAFSVAVLTMMIPPIDTDSDMLRLIFKRGDTYDTTYLSPGNFIFYCLMNVLGWLSVNVSNMNYCRQSIFHSNHESRRDFLLTVLFAPIFFFLGNNIILRSEHDLSGLNGPSYSYWDCMNHNFGIWTTCYIVGLQFTHLDVDMMRGFSLSPEHMRHWRKELWIVAIILFCIFLGMTGYGIFMWYQVDLIWLFFSIMALELSVFILVTRCLQQTHYLHLHHYTTAMLAIPLLGIQVGFAAAMGGFVNGVMIEGASRWGYDPIWQRRQEDSECSREEKPQIEEESLLINGPTQSSDPSAHLI